VLNRLGYFKQRPWLRRGAWFAAHSGAAQLLGSLHRGYSKLQTPSPPPLVSEVDTFGPWADTLFRDALHDYPITARRDAAALNAIYPEHDPRFCRLCVRCPRTGRDLGWIVVCLSRVPGKYFGDLTVGALADGFGKAADVPTLIWAGVQNLVNRGAEIIVANWSHPAWMRGCKKYGFLPGPSNYFALLSPEAGRLLPSPSSITQFHLTRGDSDGLNIFHADTGRTNPDVPGHSRPTNRPADELSLPHDGTAESEQGLRRRREQEYREEAAMPGVAHRNPHDIVPCRHS